MIFCRDSHRVSTPGLASRGELSRDWLRRECLVGPGGGVDCCGLLQPEVIDILVQLRINLRGGGAIVVTFRFDVSILAPDPFKGP